MWAVGKEGTVLHWDGTAWGEVPSGTSAWLRAIWGEAPDDLWAAGGATILHWNGERWSEQQSVAEKRLRAIGGAGDAVWAVGSEGTIVHRRP